MRVRRILDCLVLAASCVLGLAVFDEGALAVDPGPELISTGSGADAPLLGGLAALGFWWFWRRWLRRDVPPR